MLQKNNIIRGVVYIIAIVCISAISIKYILNTVKENEQLQSEEHFEVVSDYTDIMVSASMTSVDDDKIEVDVQADEKADGVTFPIYIESPRINVEIYDYYFQDTLPQDVCEVNLVEYMKEIGSGNFLDEDGNFDNSVVFMVMKYKVVNNLDEAWTYGANSAAIEFGVDEGIKFRPLQEMIYYTAMQRTDHERMMYDFEPHEEYTATCIFKIWDLDSFFNEDRSCYLVFGTSGSNVLLDEDRLLPLDRTRWKDKSNDEDEKTDEDEFPIYIESPRINVEIYDYYFQDTLPQDVCKVDLEEYLKTISYGTVLDGDGQFNNNAIFMVMDYKVTNNLDEEWTYAANSASIKFARGDELPMGKMNEMIYFTAMQREGHESMLYDFMPFESYTATCIFIVDELEYFYDDEIKCYLLFGSGSRYLTEDDRLFLLDRTRWKDKYARVGTERQR